MLATRVAAASSISLAAEPAGCRPRKKGGQQEIVSAKPTPSDSKAEASKKKTSKGTTLPKTTKTTIKNAEVKNKSVAFVFLLK